MLKKTADGRIAPDHQYMSEACSTDTRQAAGIADVDNTGEGKENHRGPNILFLCDICKSVFNNVISLRVSTKSYCYTLM